jgi:hypothetical protein
MGFPSLSFTSKGSTGYRSSTNLCSALSYFTMRMSPQVPQNTSETCRTFASKITVGLPFCLFCTEFEGSTCMHPVVHAHNQCCQDSLDTQLDGKDFQHGQFCLSFWASRYVCLEYPSASLETGNRFTENRSDNAV